MDYLKLPVKLNLFVFDTLPYFFQTFAEFLNCLLHNKNRIINNSKKFKASERFREDCSNSNSQRVNSYLKLLLFDYLLLSHVLVCGFVLALERCISVAVLLDARGVLLLQRTRSLANKAQPRQMRERVKYLNTVELQVV